MAVWYFNTTGWGGTDSATDLGTLTTALFGTNQTYRVSTVDRALTLCSAGDTVAPEPPWTDSDGNQHGFFDAGGFPVQRVDVSMLSSLTISKTVTLCGGAYRLRLDGVGAYWIQNRASINYADVDIVRMNNQSGGAVSHFVGGSQSTYTRCLLGGLRGSYAFWIYAGTVSFTDCAFVANAWTSTTNTAEIARTWNSATFTRCVIHDSVEDAKTDCINLCNLDQTAVNAIGFVSPPKVYDTTNPGYYTDGTAWTNTDWESVDLHLLSTSSYATGGTSVTSGSTVYDLDGLPRKVGGALGAYECLSATHYAFKMLPGWKYKLTQTGTNPPEIAWAWRKTGGYPPMIFDASQCASVEWWRPSTSSWVNSTTYGGVSNVAIGLTYKLVRGISSDGGITTIQYYAPGDVAPDDALDCAIGAGASMFTWETATGGAITTAPTSASVLYLGYNNVYADTQTSVSKIYVPGKRHVVLGNNGGGAELVIGLGATVTASGSVAIKEETNTDAELWAKLTLESGATLTLDDCATSDAA